MSLTRRAAVLVPALFAPALARAQGFPSRPIRLVVGFPPGGGSDLVARPLAQRLGEILGQPVAVENRGGANGTLGLAEVAKSAPDGHVIGHVNNSVIGVNPLLYRNLPFDAARDLAPLCTVTLGGLFFMVPAALPARTLMEFVELAKRQPGQLNFGSGGPGSITHLAFELFARQAGVEVVHVPYRGSAPALQDMLGGRVQLMIDGINLAKPQVDSGALRALAILTPERHPMMPEVPTARESGLPELVVEGWQGFVVRAGTPEPVLERLQEGMRAALADPAVQDVFRAQAIVTRFHDRRDMARMIAAETAKWRPIIERLGLRLD